MSVGTKSGGKNICLEDVQVAIPMLPYISNQRWVGTQQGLSKIITCIRCDFYYLTGWDRLTL